MKFKVGDKVKVIKCSIAGERCKNFNKVSTITEIKEYSCCPYMLKDIGEAFRDDELELVEVQFTKSDLKDGDYCVFKNGDKAIKIGNYVGTHNAVVPLREYNNKLEHNFNPRRDIVRVDRPTEYETIYKNDGILDSTEKKYLAAVIAPFRDKIKNIAKIDKDNGNQYICICHNGGLYIENIALPYFKSGTMYVGMKSNRVYTLEELGL